jgi:hypothetical protein
MLRKITTLLNLTKDFKGNGEDSHDYKSMAKNMMVKGQNMFHIFKKDIKDFNPNLYGFMAVQYKNLNTEITQLLLKFIENLGIGNFKHGLYLNFNTSN